MTASRLKLQRKPLFDGDQRISRGGAGILLSDCHHVTLRNNRARDNGRWGIFASFCDDLLVEGNEASGSKLEHGLYLSNSGDRNVVRGNRLFENRLAGLHLNSDNNFHSDVYASRATVDGVSKELLVEQNIIHDNGVGGGSGINCDGIQDSIIQNNLLYNNHATGIALFQIDGYDGARRNTIVNNTIVNAADSRWAIRLVGCEDARGDTCVSASEPFLPQWDRPTAIAGGATGTVIYNNIVYNHGTSGAIYVDGASLGIDPVSNKGLASNSNRMDPRFWVDGTTRDLAGWRAATGQDDASKDADPAVLFRDVSANDYSLAKGSTAIDAADPRYAPMVDVVGQRRPIGEGPDIGAYEFCDGDECEPAEVFDAGPESPSPDGGGPAAADASNSTDKEPTVGGGCCTCATGATSSGGVVVVLLFLTWVMRRALYHE